MRRFFIRQPLFTGAQPSLSNDQIHYLLHVLRIRQGNTVLLFNGQHGEWHAECREKSRKGISLHVTHQERPQPTRPTLLYCFAPVKHTRLDYMIQKAVEMGVGILQPVMTHYTQAMQLNPKRMYANAIKAAEQCGILSVPDCRRIISFDTLLATWDPIRHLIFCDETAESYEPFPPLRKLVKGPIGIIIGPEGGFDNKERESLQALDYVITISLGPRILRADTAAVAALAIINTILKY